MTSSTEEKLKILFSRKLQEKKEEELLLSVGMLGFDIEWFRDLVLLNYDPTTRSLKISNVVDSTTERMRELLNEGGFAKRVAGQELEQQLVDGFKSLIEIKIEFNVLFLTDYETDLLTISQYKEFLLSKKRQLTLRDKWGDPDLAGWNKLASDFACEKLTAGVWDNAFSGFSPIVQDHLTSCNQGKFGAAFVLHSLKKEISHADTRLAELSIIKDGRDYEIFLSKQIQETFPMFIVELTPITGDQGADIIVSTPSSKIAIQAKYYSFPVGNSAVQEIYAAKKFYEADECLVVCNSSYTPAARILASKTGVLLTTDIEYLSVLRELS
jgi:Restriction endonuclease